ncbi:MAG: YceD family protein [Micrococcales bacterium]
MASKLAGEGLNSPYAIGVHDLMHKPGAMRRVDTEFAIPEALTNSVATVPAGSEVELESRLESVHEGILVTGTLFGDAEAECSRCLDPLKLPIEVDFQELFAYSLTEQDEFAVLDEHIDLEQVIRDAVVLSLPFQPVCSADCLGLCVECGQKLAENPNHVHEAAIDSRWSALQNFKEE